ncbi:MAG TPA: HAD-IA family hydrolase [Bauldia sp.]|nr:HAD-IA family hydrolase [Bauldia sp.]
MHNSRPTIVFDLDGTLVDTRDDLVATLNAILVADGMQPMPSDKVIGMVGSGSRVLIESAFAYEGRTLTAERLDRLLAAFLAYYDEHIVDASRPYPGTEAMLDRFISAGWLLAVCTNKYEAPAKKLLGLLGLEHRFAAITGQDTFGFRKPDPRHLTETIALARGNPSRAVMVGDSATDIDTARAAAIPVVAVTFGYSTVPVASLRPDRVIDTYSDLFAAVETLPFAKAPS